MAKKPKPTPAIDNGQSPEQGITYGGVIVMTPEEWSQVLPNPRQRDTIAHAAKATHLRTLHPVHCNVNAARLPDGSLFKLDGHTRDHLWNSGEVEGPKELRVTIWNCPTMEDVVDLYLTFDSPDAVENVTDLLYGLCNELGIEFTSPALEKHRFAAALSMANGLLFGGAMWNRWKLRRIIEDWKDALIIFDQCEPTKLTYTAPVMAAALLITRRFGEAAKPFLKGYQHNEGTKGHGQMDAIQALTEYIIEVRAGGSFWGSSKRSEIIRTTVEAYRAYSNGKMYDTAKGSGRALSPMRSDYFSKWIDDVVAHGKKGT